MITQTFDSRHVARKLRNVPKAAWRVLLTTLALAGVLANAKPAEAQTAFYGATEQELTGEPGTIIRQEPLRFAPAGASAYRVLYRSRGLRNEPIAVSGIIVVPPGEAPAGGRPVVAWAHPTTGIVPRCAPSLAIFHFQQIQGLRDLVERGYVVTATDYPGLGTEGPHPYLVGESEARAVIDSVRAARVLQGDSGNRFAVWGHSQGGQAALFTGMLARQYAPELNLVGVAAAAPATELATLLEDDLNTNGGRNLTAMTLWSWARVFGAPIERVVDLAAMPIVDQLAQECIESIYDLIERSRTAQPLAQHFLSQLGLAELAPWKTLLAQNTPGILPANVPVFLAQGLADQLVRPNVTRDYAARLCAHSSPVQLVLMPGVNHGFAAMRSTDAATAWIADRFDGNAAPSNCASLPAMPVRTGFAPPSSQR